MQTPVRTLLASKGYQVYTVGRDATVAEAVGRMNDLRVGALVVVGKDGTPTGMFSERDVLSRVVAEKRDPETTFVAEVMTSGVHMISPSTTVQEAMILMTEKRCRHFPVADENGLAGMISIGDLTRWNLRDQEYLINDLVGYITTR